MATIDSAPEGGKFRAIASAALGGTAGAWGNGDLLCVTMNASGELVVGSATDAIGVILTSEGKRDNLAAGFKQVVAGAKYTVLRQATLVECDTYTSPTVAAGDSLWTAAAGDVTATPGAGAIFIGRVLLGDGAGMVLELNVGEAALAGGTLIGADFKYAAIAGGAAGNHTVTGIDTTDTLAAVIEQVDAIPVQTAVAGGAAGDITVTGIATADTLVSVIFFDDLGGTAPAVTDLTSEFTITGASTINNAGGTATTGGFLLVTYLDALTDDIVDLTSEFTISAPDTIENAGHTNTTGAHLLVAYVKAP